MSLPRFFWCFVALSLEIFSFARADSSLLQGCNCRDEEDVVSRLVGGESVHSVEVMLLRDGWVLYGTASFVEAVLTSVGVSSVSSSAGRQKPEGIVADVAATPLDNGETHFEECDGSFSVDRFRHDTASFPCVRQSLANVLCDASR